MTTLAKPILDRADDDRVVRSAAAPIDMVSPRRGALEQARDGSQHRRFTAFWEDLMN